MATSGSFSKSIHSGHYTFKFSWERISVSTSGNYSEIKCKLQLISSGSGYYISSSTSKTVKMWIDGTAYSDTCTVGISANSTKTLMTKTVKVYHNDDGTKSCKFDWQCGFGITLSGTTYGTQYGDAKTVTLTAIPRYAKISSFKNTAKTINSATFSWATDAKCSKVVVTMSGASSGTSTPFNNSTSPATSGNFTINNLKPNKTYNFTITVTRSDSGLTTTSSSISVTTNQIATVSSAVNFVIGNNLSVTIANSSRNASVLTLEAYDQVTKAWVAVGSSKTVAAGTSSTTLSLSSEASTLYSYCPNNTSLDVRLICAWSSDTTYKSIVLGTATVSNSNPDVSKLRFTISDTNSTITNLLSGLTNTYVYGKSKIKLTIPSANKAVAKNGASIKGYAISIDQGTKNVLTASINEASGDLSYTLNNTALSAGSYKISLATIDSRNSIAESSSSYNITILPYHEPTVRKLTIQRRNDFEKECYLVCDILVSRLLDKNTTFSVTSNNTALNSSLVSNASYFNSTVNGNDYIKTYYIDSTKHYNIIVPSEESRTFTFTIKDSLSTITKNVVMDKGIPIFMPCDTGHVTVGMLPALGSDALLQVGSDIIATDTDGIQHYLLEDLADLEGDITSLNASIKTTNNNLSTSNSNIDNLQISVDKTNTNITTLTNKIKNMLCTTHSMTVTTTTATNWSITVDTTPSAVLVGTNLRCYFAATRSSEQSAGNITNQDVITFKVNHGGKIKNAYSTAFTGATSGGLASFFVIFDNTKTTDTTLVFTVRLNALAQAMKSTNAYFALPVRLNYDKF